MQQTITRDLFISHADKDREWVRGYLLPALGLSPERILTPQDFPPGTPLVDAFERAVLESRYTLLVLSRAYLADQWLKFGGQLANFLSVDEQANRLIPLLLDDLELPPQLRFRVGLDYSAETSWEDATKRLREVFQSPSPSEQPILCPYPGMVPFGAEDAQRFYGREAEVQQMVDQLREQQLLFVIGPSGSGKSSLIFAGLLPRLASGIPFPPDFWRVYTLRPGAQPTKRLVELLAGDLSSPAEIVRSALARPPAAQRLLLVIDQFEELFTQAERGEQMSFIAALLSLRSFENCALLITMRADFYPDLMNSTLWPLLPSQRLELAPLRGAALRDAIRCPAAAVGVYLEPVLVERLVHDGRDEPGVLPLLQETMQLLWSKRQRRLLTLSAYEQMGQNGSSGLAVAVANKADRTLERLTPAQRQIVRRVFLCLVQLGENAPDTRRQQPLCELRSPNDDPRDFDVALEQLTANRLVIRSGEAAGPQDGQERHVRVDLSHEMLITSWPQLKSWLEEDRAGLLLHRRFSQTCDDWVRNKRDASFLYSGSRLLAAQRYVQQHPQDVSTDEIEFLKASAAREPRLYMGQAAGGAQGASFGLGLALALGDWSQTGFALSRIPILFALITMLVIQAFGQLLGFGVGLGLWWWRNAPLRRVIATTLIGALMGSLAHLLSLVIRAPVGGSVPLKLIAAGTIFGAAIGLSIGIPARGWRRMGLVVACCVGAAVLNVALGTIDWELWVALLAGLLLGGCTSLGFMMTAVDHSEQLIE